MKVAGTCFGGFYYEVDKHPDTLAVWDWVDLTSSIADMSCFAWWAALRVVAAENLLQSDFPRL